MTSAGPAGVAIIGIACRFPGAPDHRTFWRNLCGGVESISFFSDAELREAGVDPALLHDPAYVRAAPVLADVDRFDAAFFEYSPKEARLMDPQHRLLLEVAWEAFEDAGYRPGASEAPVGVFVGSGGVVTSYLVNHLPDAAELPGQTGSLSHIGNDKDFLSTRISYKLDLRGPSLNVQTACSTSLVAVHLAAQAILAGECDMALAGAATVRVPQRAGYLSVKGDILSPDGHCRAFDAEAQGTVFGSGVGVVLLKDVAMAVADRDNIYAVIRGTAINNDGAAKVSYTASSVPGQARAMVEAMGLAGISPDAIGYVECHGTGTVVGDPLEIEALTRAFRTRTSRSGYCAVGSVKTNIGHLEQTAGIAALIKAALSLKHGTIPPSLNFRKANPKIDFARSPFYVNTERRDWPAGERPRVAAVNSLGLGGTNAFAVLEEAPDAAPAPAPHERPLHIATLSAKSETALRALIERHARWLDDGPDSDIADLCYTLNTGRSPFAHRFAAVVGSIPELRAALAKAVDAEEGGAPPAAERRIAFLFSGQGSQYAGMAAEIYRGQPVFRAALDRCAALLDAHLDRPLLEVLFAEGEDAALINETAYTQPALFAVQVALAELWKSWGVVPDAVMGHSVGEFAAACCAGAYAPEDGARLIAGRARAMQALPRGGAMAAVFADEPTVLEAVARHGVRDLGIAAVNGPLNTVVSGDQAAIAALTEAFTAAGIKCQPLTVSHAFHSPLIEPAVTAFAPLAERIVAQAPKLAWISNLTGAAVSEPPGADYWCEHARRAVRFADGVRALDALGITDFIEIGPGTTLLAMARQSVGAGDRAWLPSLSRSRGDWRELLESLRQLYLRGYDIDWAGFDRPYVRRRVSLPTYAFQRERFWLDRKAAGGLRERVPGGDSRLLGVRLRSALAETQFETRYGLERLGFLDDHRIYANPVLPTTFGLAALCEAARQHFGTDAVAVANVSYREAMVLPEAGERLVQVIVTPSDEASAEFKLASLGADEGETWRTHMIGLIRRAPSPARRDGFSPSRLKARCPAEIPVERFYATLQALGLGYGPAFRGIQALRRGRGEVLTRVRLAEHVADEPDAPLHPALLDACLHAYPALVEAYGDFERPPAELRRTFLPIGVESFRMAGSPAREVWAHLVRREGGPGDVLVADIDIYGDDGAWLAGIEGLALKPLAPEVLAPAAPAKIDWLYRLSWSERPALPPSDAAGAEGGWLILADRGGLGAALGDALASAGGRCSLIRADDLTGPDGRPAWQTPSALREALSSRIDELQGAGPLLRGVVHLWGADVALDGLPLDRIEEAERLTAGSALALVQAVAAARARSDAAPRIWLVTRNAVGATPADRPAEAAQALLWGLGRSAALEHPQIWGGLVDLGDTADTPATGLADVLRREIVAGDGEDQIALRAGRRFAARLVRASAPEPAGRAGFAAEGACLITGGLGALGVEVAKWLITRQGVRNLVLVSRRGSEDPNAAPVAHALEALGAKVVVGKADVTQEADVRRLLGEIAASGSRLKGVFHCAGLLDDGVLMQMDWPKFHGVVAPKMGGAWLLHALTRDLALDHFVLFSSILGLIGSAGQTNYAAANTFLDALGERRRSQGLPVQVINWGPWAESGLATLSGEKGEAIWRARGTRYIPVETGWEALSLLVGSELAEAAVTLTEWPVFLQQFAAVPPLYRELDEARPRAGAARKGIDAQGLRQRLREAPAAERRRLLVAFVAELAMATLGLTEAVETTRPLREFGLDSLMSVTLVNRLETALGVKVPAVTMIQGPSVEQLVDEVFPDLRGAGAEAAVSEAPRTSRAGDDWLVVVGPQRNPRCRLFCFPFAGGGSAVYRSWAESLDPAIEIVAIEPPGRLGRINERPVHDIREFVARLLPAMSGMLDRPFAFFGHCLGGLTMFETTRALMRTTGLRPDHLFASGARPPHMVGDIGAFEQRLVQDLLQLAAFRINLPSYLQPDDVFAEIIRRFNIQATEQLIADPELRRLMLPVIRAEFAMATHYRYVPERPWEIPITCFVARGDSYVSRQHALGWGGYTNTRFQVHMREGGHFAVADDTAFLHSIISRELLAH